MRIIKFIATILIVLLQLFGTSRSLDASVTERMVQKKKCYSQKLEAVLKNTDKLSLSYFKNANKGILYYGKKASPECFEAYYPIYETQQILALQQLSSMYKLDDPAHSESRCVPEWSSSSADRLKFDVLKAEFLAAGITLVFKNAEGGARCMAYFTKGWHTETFGHLFNDAWNQYYRITNPLVGRPLFQDAGVSISYSDLAKHILAIDKFLIDYPKFPLIYRQTKNSENIKINWEDIHTLDLDKRFSAFFEFFLQSYDNSRVFISDHENKRYYLPKDGRYTNSQTVMMNLFSKVQNKSLKKTLMDFYAYLEANDFKFNWGTVRGTVNNEIDQFFKGMSLLF